MSPVITSYASNKNTKLLNECKTALALNHCVPVICFHNHILQSQNKSADKPVKLVAPDEM